MAERLIKRRKSSEQPTNQRESEVGVAAWPFCMHFFQYLMKSCARVAWPGLDVEPTSNQIQSRLVTANWVFALSKGTRCMKRGGGGSDFRSIFFRYFYKHKKYSSKLSITIHSTYLANCFINVIEAENYSCQETVQQRKCGQRHGYDRISPKRHSEKHILDPPGF